MALIQGKQIRVNLTGSFTGSFAGSFSGSGANLIDIPASGIVGLNLSQISSGSVSASISPGSGLQVNTNVTATSFTGSLQGTSSFAISSSFAQTASVTPSGSSIIGGTGANGQVAFWNGTNSQTGDNGLFWDNTNKRLEIINPSQGNSAPLIVKNTIPYQSPFNQFIQFWQAGSGSNVMTLRADGALDTIGNIRSNTLRLNGSGTNTTNENMLARNGQPQTGINFLSGHVLGFTTNSAERMRILSTGEVTIGATTAGARLDVRAQGALSTDVAFRVRNSADTLDTIQVRGDGVTNFNLATGQSISLVYLAGTAINIDGTRFVFRSGNSFSVGGGRDFLRLQTVATDRLVIDSLGRVAISTANPVNSAQLQVDSTNRGFLPPRMTTTQRDAITSPAMGLILYATSSTDEGIYYYNSGSQIGWHKLLSDTGSQSITGSLNVTQGITGSLFGTASFATTASFVNTLNQNVTVSGSLKLDPTQDPDPTGADLDSTVLFQSSSNTTLGYDLYIRQNGNLVKWKWIEGNLETGLLYGGVVTYSGSNVFVSPGSGIIAEHNATTSSEISPMVEYVTWNAITQSVANIATQQVTYLYIDNTGALQQQSTRFTTQQYHNYIPLGAVGHFDYTQVSAFGGSVQTAYDQISQMSNFIDAFGPLKKSGYGLTGQAGSLRLSVGSGTSFIHGGFYENDPEFPSEIATPSQATASLARVNRSGSAVEFDTNGGNLYTVIDPTKYDRDGDGTLANVGNGNWSIQRVFSDPKTGVLYVYYGQARYTSLLNALQYLPTDPFTEGDTFDFTTFVGFLVLKGNASDITDTASNSIINGGLFRGSGQGSGGGIALSNLEDLTDVSVTSPTNGQALIYDSGIWQNGTPLNATSASFAQTASVTPSGSSIIGGTGANGQVAFWNGANSQSGDNGLFWDNTNKRLGIGTNAPTVTIDAIGNEYRFAATSGAINFYNTPGVNQHFNFINVRQDSDYIFKQNRGGAVNTTSLLIKGNTGNVGISTTNPQARLDVRAQGALSTDIAFRVRNSADTGDLMSVNGAGGIGLFGLTSINGAGVANTALAVYGNGNGGGNFLFRMYDASAVERIQLTASGNLRLDGATDNGASGDDNKVRMFFNFSPTSGTRSHTGITLGQTINQTGGANGITRGLFINPTLTSAADFRAIETTVGNVILGSTSGNVGIGTTSPTKKLQLNISASDDGFLMAKPGSANSIFRVTMDGTNDRGEMFLNNGATIVMAIRQASNPSYINTGNNFGIGTSNPQARLDVRAQGALSTDIAFRVRNSADTANLMMVNGSGTSITRGDSTEFYVNSNDTLTNVGRFAIINAFGSSSPIGYLIRGGGIERARIVSDDASGNLIIQNSWTNYAIQFNTNGANERMRITPSGNVGIGTTTPNARLDVNGNTIITGSLQVSQSLLQYSNNASITSGSTANIASFNTSSYTAGFFDYVATSGTNARAGTVFTVWNANNVEFTETSTNDIGNTSNLILSASLSAGAIRLQGTSLSGSWSVKTLTRMI
jgi:hypothetical protein